MHILHFCSYYVGSKVYFELFSSLSKKNKQQVYVPVRSKKHCSTKQAAGVNFYFIKNLTIFTRLFFCFKLLVIILPALKRYRQNNEIDVIHAHTLYADGIPAFILSKIMKKRLVIAIRNTDVNLGFKFYRHYKWLAKKALSYSSKIICISPAHKVMFQAYFGHDYDSKLVIIPNGIDNFYIENVKQVKVRKSDKRIALHVAAIDKNKNLKQTIFAFFSGLKECKGAEFRVAGGTYKDYQKVFGDLPEDLKDKVFFLGKLNKDQLIEQMSQASVFVMVSHLETFGLVYIEAISQCLPIVFTHGQGVDGYFENGEYGFRAEAYSVESISIAISSTLTKFPDGLGPFIENPAKSFSWRDIAQKYCSEIYEQSSL